MTREEWNAAQPVLTRALFLSPEEQRAVIESAFQSEGLRRELLDVLRRTSPVLPLVSLTPSGQGGSARSGSGALDPQEPPAPSLLTAGQPLGSDERFVVVRQLGRGGMGEVYLAHDRTLGNLVALKVLYEIELREAQRARAASGHPHIVTMYDVFTVDLGGRPRTVLVLEYIVGKPASQRVDEGPIPLRNAVRWAREIASAMAHAHDRGVLHCDLKPANVLITPEDGAKVLDFGIGRATFDRPNPLERLQGTLPYMAPEQLRDRQFSQAGDVYSLGVTLFEMVTGRLPFDGSTLEVMLQIVGAEPPRASIVRTGVPPILDEVLARALAKDPDVRYRTPRALDRALDEVEQELTTQTSPVPAPLIAPIPARRGPLTYVGWAVQALLLLTVLGFVSSTTLNSGLERTGPFQESPLWWPVYGAMSLTAPLLLTAAAALVLAVTLPLARSIARRTSLGSYAAGLRARAEALPTGTLAQVILTAHVIALAMFVWYYAPMIDAITSFMSDDPGADISGLGPQYSGVHGSYRRTMTLVMAVAGLAWYGLSRRSRADGEASPLTRLAGAAVFLLSLLIHVAPHRLIYLNDSEQVRYGGQPCSLVGQSGNDALLFCPLRKDRSHRVRLDDPNLVKTGIIDDIFLPLSVAAEPSPQSD